MLTRLLTIIASVVVAAVLGALASDSSQHRQVSDEMVRAATSPMVVADAGKNCGRANLRAGQFLADIQSLIYRGYLVQKAHKLRPDGDSGMVDVSYTLISRKGRAVAKLDGDIRFVIGNSNAMGFFQLLKSGREQLIVSQDAPRTGRQWVVDFDETPRVIFDGPRFDVGREGDDMTFADLDDDGTYEIFAPVTSFFGFEDVLNSEAPMPNIVFKYDAVKKQYLPANPQFKDCILKETEADKNRLGPQPHLASVMSITLDYIFAGEEQVAWRFFDKSCVSPDKERIKVEIQQVLKRHPVYRYIYNKTDNR